MKSFSKILALVCCNLLIATSSWALIQNNSCSSGNAKSSGCKGGNEVGGPASSDAGCCSKAIAKLPGLLDKDNLAIQPTKSGTTKGLDKSSAAPSASTCPCGAPGCPCEKSVGNPQDLKTKTGPLKPSPTNPAPPSALARPCPAYAGDPCDGTPGNIGDGKVKGKIKTSGDK